MISSRSCRRRIVRSPNANLILGKRPIEQPLDEGSITGLPDLSRSGHTRPKWLNPNGSWEFERDPGRSGLERGLPSAERLAERITVPFCMESELSGIGHKDFCEAVWYRRRIAIPDDWAGQRVLLHIGAC